MNNINKKLVSSQVEDDLAHFIMKECRVGDRLPNEFQLAEKFHTSRSTIREVVKSLASQGILEVRQGSGTYVTALERVDDDPLHLSRHKDKYRLALELFRYAVESRLQWSPSEMRDYLSMEIVTLLCLRPVLRYIRFPSGMVPERSLFYIAWQLYPRTKNKTVSDVDMETYQMFLDGRLYKMPKDFFSGDKGFSRAKNCLIYAVNTKLHFPSDDLFSLYEFFATNECVTFLGEMKLMKVCRSLRMTPLEYLHSALKETQRSEVLFHYFSFLLRYAPREKRENRD